MRHPHSSLPPGFRFHLTDEELILHYLMKKLSSSAFPVSIIADADFYSSIPGTYQIKLCLVRKNGTFSDRETESTQMVQGQNGAAGSGFWKATETDKIIVASSMAAGRGGVHSDIGVKKALVFHRQNKPSAHLLNRFFIPNSHL
ncbi:NAC transcription factor 47-like [Gossypium hirsutum]|uniref:NAC transcription factor 47-like n=1 Tax=Gossypium hirsutum TaxID=3635 RepID=A0ABM3BJL0_GOSHI|nr:NAC transcription factor 47-like [Gossypium hirsutum]